MAFEQFHIHTLGGGPRVPTERAMCTARRSETKRHGVSDLAPLWRGPLALPILPLPYQYRDVLRLPRRSRSLAETGPRPPTARTESHFSNTPPPPLTRNTARRAQRLISLDPPLPAPRCWVGGRGVGTGSATPPSIGHRTRWRGGVGFEVRGAVAALRAGPVPGTGEARHAALAGNGQAGPGFGRVRSPPSDGGSHPRPRLLPEYHAPTEAVLVTALAAG